MINKFTWNIDTFTAQNSEKYVTGKLSFDGFSRFLSTEVLFNEEIFTEKSEYKFCTG